MGIGVGDQFGEANPPLGGKIDGGPASRVAVPVVLQRRGETPEICEQIDLHPVVVELLAQPQPDAVALHESGGARPASCTPPTGSPRAARGSCR